MIETEAPLEPELPICDAHHHLWERPPRGYMLDDLLQDLRSGHNIVSTVAVECRYAYRRDGPAELKPVGEVEFLESVADRAATDPKIKHRLAAAIVGHADLLLGDAVEAVLEKHSAASPQRFRGIRHAATWDASDALRSEAPRGLMGDRNFRQGLACLEKLHLSFDAWVYHPQLVELTELAQAFPGVQVILNHIGAPLGIGPYTSKRAEVFQSVEQWHRRTRQMSERGGKVGRRRFATFGLRLARARGLSVLAGASHHFTTILRALHRSFRR